MSTTNFNSKRAEEQQNNALWRIEDMAEELAIYAKETKVNKAIAIILTEDKEAGTYEHHRLVVNMTNSELIALLQIVAMRLAREMGE